MNTRSPLLLFSQAPAVILELMEFFPFLPWRNALPDGNMLHSRLLPIQISSFPDQRDLYPPELAYRALNYYTSLIPFGPLRLLFEDWKLVCRFEFRVSVIPRTLDCFPVIKFLFLHYLQGIERLLINNPSQAMTVDRPSSSITFMLFAFKRTPQHPSPTTRPPTPLFQELS